jgi:hypothetical protein
VRRKRDATYSDEDDQELRRPECRDCRVKRVLELPLLIVVLVRLRAAGGFAGAMGTTSVVSEFPHMLAPPFLGNARIIVSPSSAVGMRRTLAGFT